MKSLDNLSLARIALALLEKSGVRTVVICAGARNAPLVKSLEHFPQFEVLYFFDERAAAFFALGRSKATHAAVAIITTSGTAVAELLPAVVEARYSNIPLILVTADRPKFFRGRGAPQSIEQIGMFSHFIASRHQADWDSTQFDYFEVPKNLPSHLNICFSEPLLSEEIVSVTGVAGEFENVKHPLVVLGEIPERYREDVESFLLKLKAPVYAEAHSGLRHSNQLKDLLLRSGDRYLATEAFQSQFDGVLRIGSVPTTRLWRDLEDKLLGWGVLSVCDIPMSGLGRKSVDAVTFQTFFKEQQAELLGRFTWAENQSVLAEDRSFSQRLEKNLKAHSNSEPGFVRRLSENLVQDARVFVGNSLPIREWDLAASPRAFEVAGNRGVNGIDGLISTFLGWAVPERENVILLGDLSALYDLSALWTDAQKMTVPVKIVVINNSGGQIFQRMFRDPKFINEHSLEFSQWAKMFGLDYLKIDENSSESDWKNLSKPVTKSLVVELIPNADETNAFWSEYEKTFK